MRGYLAFIGAHFLFSFIVLPGIFFLFTWLSRLLSGNSEVSIKETFVHYSWVLVPTGLAIWAAFSVGIILPNGSYLLHVLSDPFAWGWDLFGTAGFPWTPVLTGAMPYIQLIVLIVGLVLSLDYNNKLSRRIFGSSIAAVKGSIPIVVFLTGAYIFFIWLFLG